MPSCRESGLKVVSSFQLLWGQYQAERPLFCSRAFLRSTCLGDWARQGYKDLTTFAQHGANVMGEVSKGCIIRQLLCVQACFHPILFTGFDLSEVSGTPNSVSSSASRKTNRDGTKSVFMLRSDPLLEKFEILTLVMGVSDVWLGRLWLILWTSEPAIVPHPLNS